MPTAVYDTMKEEIAQVERLLADGWEQEVLPRLPKELYQILMITLHLAEAAGLRKIQ